MKLLAVLLFVLLGVVAFVVFKLQRRDAQVNSDDGEWPFYAKKPLSEPEQVLYHRLVAALPECIVLAQVQLSRVLGVKKGFSVNEWNNRINRMSLDFVVCLKDSTVVAAIELDDKTHGATSRVAADAKKDRALAAAAIPVVRWNVTSLPDEATIRRTFASTGHEAPPTLPKAS